MPWYDSLRQFDRSSFDYPGTRFFIEARNFRAPPSGRRLIKHIVIHITGGPCPDERCAVNRFLSTNVSAHYIINRDGDVIQMVRDQNIANHIVNLNYIVSQLSIGIEHVNTWNRQTHQHPTPIQYNASVALVKWLTQKYAVPRRHSTDPNTSGIIGHNEAYPSTGHSTCPTPAWDWASYMCRISP